MKAPLAGIDPAARSIRLVTAVPGPKSRALTARRNAAVPAGLSQLMPIFVHSAAGAVVEDVDGNRFVDLAGGIGCVNTGHSAPEVVAAVRSQAGRFLHPCFMVAPYEGYLALAERLNALAPGPSQKKTFFVNSGAEAVENAIKLARAFTGRPAVICFEDAFHGRTLMAMSLTSKTHPYKAGFGPFAPEVYRVPYGYCYRCSYALRYPSCGLHCVNVLEETFKRVVAAESVAAIIVEPVLGEGGFVSPPAEYLPALQALCRKHGILLIADEVQTGFGRTGKMFACEHTGVEPDLLVTAKSLGGGLPIGAVTGRAEIMDHTGPGSIGGTFGGSPVACEAALAAIGLLERDHLCERAMVLGARFRERAEEWRSRCALIGDIRGVGAMQAIELVKDADSKAPATEATKRLVRHCYERGVLIVTAGTSGNVVRLLMPLVISQEEFEEALDVLEAGFYAVA
jgi:4-aminobutyrate aminotransferase/(S)-3-amino-2-methylpropionate transaminase